VKDERTKKDEYQKALTAYSEALKEFRKGKFEKAAEMLRGLVEKHPGEREFADRARTYLAICEERLREPREVPNPKTFEDFCHHGVYRMNRGEYDEAQKMFDKAAKLNPEAAVVPYLTAALLSAQGKIDEAVESLKKAVLADKFYKTLAQNEADFEPLWDDKRFKLLTRMA
jgi:predicted Zn-dependent protease